MKSIRVIIEPTVDCPATGEIVFLGECKLCGYFCGYNLRGTEIGCMYGE